MSHLVRGVTWVWVVVIIGMVVIEVFMIQLFTIFVRMVMMWTVRCDSIILCIAWITLVYICCWLLLCLICRNRLRSLSVTHSVLHQP